MLRVLCSAAKLIPRVITPVASNNVLQKALPALSTRNFGILAPRIYNPGSLLNNPKLKEIINYNQTRTVIKFSIRKGTRKCNKQVLMRFYRLGWGGWIRTKCGRGKRLWRKSPPRKRRLRQHVLCNASQSYLLDKMAGKYWTRRRYYVDDPYEPYHSREGFSNTARKPKPYIPAVGIVPSI